MADVIAVLNAGSSSFKFSLFAVAPASLEVLARGQAEGLYTSPRFVAKNSAGAVLEDKA
jgi:acetate kinase